MADAADTRVRQPTMVSTQAPPSSQEAQVTSAALRGKAASQPAPAGTRTRAPGSAASSAAWVNGRNTRIAPKTAIRRMARFSGSEGTYSNRRRSSREALTFAPTGWSGSASGGRVLVAPPIPPRIASSSARGKATLNGTSSWVTRASDRCHGLMAGRAYKRCLRV